MAINSEKIQLGVCDVSFGGVDLGATKGGVEVEISTESYEVKADQTGETLLKEIIMGTMVTVKVPLVETDLDRLKAMIPQSVQIVGAAAPTGFKVNNIAGYGVGDAQIAVDSGTGEIKVGHTFKFAGHRTVYVVTATDGSTGITFRPKNGGAGLEAPVSDEEALTFYASTGGVEIRTGVNVDLLDFAALLVLHPTGVDAGDTENDFTVFKAAPNPNFSFKYETGAEKVYEVTFKGYADTANNNRVAAFGAAS